MREGDYIPIPEELIGESYQYCYAQPVVTPPPDDDVAALKAEIRRLREELARRDH